MTTQLEIAVFSHPALKIAENSQADRLEICDNYASGGLTPSMEWLAAVREEIRKPALIMIRPHDRNFHYSPQEFEQMLKQVAHVSSLGFDGIVTGVLDSKLQPDLPMLRELRDAADEMEITFHRAFDLCPDPFQAIEVLSEAGLDRILSAAWNEKDLATAVEYHKFCGEEILYMPGGGIRSHNILQLRNAGFTEFHSAAITGPELLPDLAEIEKMQHALQSETH